MPYPDAEAEIPAHGPALIQDAVKRFREWSGSEATICVRAPGRVNLIGEHTDYNGGPVLPMAIERETIIVARPIPERKLRLHAANFNETAEIALDAPEAPEASSWLRYAVGAVALAPEPLGKQGAEVLILGTIPLGSGLSSSAALEMALLCLLEVLGRTSLDDHQAARLGQAIEHQFLGLKCGIMDQFACRAARSGHALFLHCSTLEHQHIPVNFPDHVFVVVDSQSARRLEESVYNDRVAETAVALHALNQHYQRAGQDLASYTISDFEAGQYRMSALAARRARHFFTETQRTHLAVEALRRGAAGVFGAHMTASHQSLREDYEVSSPALNALVEAALEAPGCLGARLTGAGFGGCTVNLVEVSEVEAFMAQVEKHYEAKTGLQCAAFKTFPSQGAGALTLSES